jgi:molybdenum cofactor guanylyltransferase
VFVKLAALLLVGGHSRRMGHDKALLKLDGVQLWRRQLAILAELQPAELLVAAPARPDWLPGDVDFIADVRPDCGPLGGVAAGLRAMKSTHLIALPVDMPAMISPHLQMLWSWADDSAGVIPSVEGRVEQMPVIYPAAAEPIALEALTGENHALSAFAETLAARGLLKIVKIGSQEGRFYANCNTPDEWSRHRTKSKDD